MTPLAPPALAVVPPVPRVVHFITVKRNVALAGRSYGHWWVELDGDESYGWWPAQAPVTTRCLFRGGPGVLNGSSGGGNATRDPNHGLAADYEFHPVLVAQRSDDQIRQAIRFFAATFRGEWRWSTRPTMNCRLFQTGALRRRWPRRRHGNYRTRGAGCPALAPLRRLVSKATGRRHWPGNLPLPGQRVYDVVGDAGRLLLADVDPIRLGPS